MLLLRGKNISSLHLLLFFFCPPFLLLLRISSIVEVFVKAFISRGGLKLLEGGGCVALVPYCVSPAYWGRRRRTGLSITILTKL